MAFSSLYQLMLTICISGFHVLALGEQSRQDWNSTVNKKRVIEGKTAVAMPNIDYVLYGYNVLFGNPLATGGTTDPGFASQIFKADYTGGLTSGDKRFLIPNGISVMSCDGNCELEFTSTEISGTKSYTDRLGVKAEVGGGAWGAKFSASADYQHVEKTSKGGCTLYTHSEIQCCKYRATIAQYSSPELTEDFKIALDELPLLFDNKTDNNKSKMKYLHFFDEFGTHFVKKAHLGAMYGEQSEISAKSWNKMVDTGIDIKTSASYSGSFSVNADLVNENEKKRGETFRSNTKNQRYYTRGKAPPADGNKDKWANGGIEEPQPIELKLRPLYNMGGLKKFLKEKKKKDVISQIMKASKKVLSNLIGNRRNRI